MTYPPAGRLDAIIADEHAGLRLDRALAVLAPEFSRSRLQALIRTGHVRLDGGTIGDPGRRVKPGEHYVIDPPPPEAATPKGEDIGLNVVYEDASLIVIDKPAGLVVHPAAGHADGTLVNALIAHCGDTLSGIGGVKRPGIVHRLDKDTTGLMVVAKTDVAHHDLSDQFRSHGADGRLERRYRALVWGVPPRHRGTIDASLGRSRTNRTRISVVNPELGRRAVTHYEVLEQLVAEDGRPVASLVELLLETGRTHQIRVHMAHIGHPVMGDPVYASGFRTSAARLAPAAGQALERLDRQALHAAILRFHHPLTGRALSFEADVPADMAELLNVLRKTAKVRPAERTARNSATVLHRKRRS